MDEKSSWMRVIITIAVDWRFVMAVVLLVLYCYFGTNNLSGGSQPSGNNLILANRLKPRWAELSRLGARRWRAGRRGLPAAMRAPPGNFGDLSRQGD